jgi:hypothetical protein
MNLAQSTSFKRFLQKKPELFLHETFHSNSALTRGTPCSAHKATTSTLQRPHSCSCWPPKLDNLATIARRKWCFRSHAPSVECWSQHYNERSGFILRYLFFYCDSNSLDATIDRSLSHGYRFSHFIVIYLAQLIEGSWFDTRELVFGGEFIESVSA